MGKISVLVFGNSFGGRITSSLAEDRSIEVHLLSDEKQDPGRFARCCRSFQTFQWSLQPEELLAKIHGALKRTGCEVLFPTYDRHVRFVSLYREELSQHVILCQVPRTEDFDIVNNKWSLHQYLCAHGLPSPNSILIDASGEYIQQAGKMRFPVLFKMCNAGNALNMKMYKDYESVRSDADHLLRFAGSGILQEYIRGSDIGCSFLCKDGEMVNYTIQASAAPRKNPFKTDRVVRFVEDQVTHKEVSRLVKMLNFSGVANLDIRIEDQTGKRMLVDFNARYWGSVCASVSAGVNIPVIACYTALGLSFARPLQNPIHYIWPVETILRVLRRFSLRHVQRFPLSRSALRFYVKDPLVYIALLLNRLRKPKSLRPLLFG
ncbi:MAG: ATP-grasp domain-containing protein [Bacteroidota bacterium]